MSTSFMSGGTKRSLPDLFQAVHHGKRSFDDLIALNVLANCKREQFTRAGVRRQVLVPNDRLAVCLDFVRLFVVDFLPVNTNVVFSYRKGVSVFDAVARHQHSSHFFVCDIASFFPSVSRQRVERTLRRGIGHVPVAEPAQWLDRFLDLMCPEDGLPMGFSTSPGVSNAALEPFDNALAEACRARGLVMSRYSDDIIVSGNSREALRDVASLISETMDAVLPGEFTLNPSKSRLLHRGMKIKLLGVVLLPDGKISVDGAMKREIEVLLHFHATDQRRFLEQVDNDLQKGERKLAGMLNHVNTIDRSFLDKLRRKFGAAAVDYFLHRSFS